MDVVREFVAQRVGELQVAQDVVAHGMRSGSFYSDVAALPSNVLITTVCTIVFAHIAALCVTHKGRSLVFGTLDTAAAVTLLALLLLLILGLPAGKTRHLRRLRLHRLVE